MFRKHGEIIAFLLLLTATAVPYGLLINTVPMPFWLTLVAATVSGVFSAIVAAPVGRVIRVRFEERALVRAYRRDQGGDR